MGCQYVPMQTVIVEHALLGDVITRIRDRATPYSRFPDLVSRATNLLLTSATAQLPTQEVTVETPVAPAHGQALTMQPLLLPVLRAGLSMLDTARRLLPEAPVGFAGLRRDEETAQATWYLESMPADLTGQYVLVLEPMVATGGTLASVIAELADRGAVAVVIVSLICSDPGLKVLAESPHSAMITVVAAARDAALTDRSYITPGLGDAGDRAFGWS